VTACRDASYCSLCSSIFALSNTELHEQIELCELNQEGYSKIYSGDVTFAEYEFLLLCELEFRQETGRHESCKACDDGLSLILEDAPR
jgi:hypothetical protein